MTTLVEPLTNIQQPELFDEQCVQIVSSLHELFLSQGNRDAYRKKYGADAVQWYMASCELLLIQYVKQQNHLLIGQVGEAHVYQEKIVGLEQIIAVHNVQSELAAGTLEQSCLAPFASRTNQQIAEQIAYDISSKLFSQLVNQDRSAFEKRIGHVQSRVIGYFPGSGGREHLGVYCNQLPLPSLNKLSISAGARIMIYYPTVDDSMPYIPAKIEARVTELLQQGFARSIVLDDKVLLDNGNLLVVPITNEGELGNPTVFS